MKHKFLSLFIAIVAMTILYSPSFASVTINGIAYELNGTTATVVRGGNYTGTIVIPASVTFSGTTYSVTSIGERVFQYCDSLTSVTIPNSVTSIGNNAFEICRRLKSITIGNSVTSIGNGAFGYCRGLTSVTIPNSVTSIGNAAFHHCSGLTSIVVENGNSVYDSRNNCNAIIITATNMLVAGCQNTTIPESVTSIGNIAFVECTGLTSVTIPNSVTSIGEGAFYGCTGLTSITIPNSVTSIGKYAFVDCSGLTSVTIPNSVTSIGESAFWDCSVSTINYIGSMDEWCNKAWSPSSISSNYHLQLNGVLQQSAVIPNSVTSIGKYAFYGCCGLTSVTIPNSVTSIGNYAFYQCTGLTSIVVENGNSVYDSRNNCNALIETATNTLIAGCQNTTIPNSVTSIGESAFDGCSSLTSVTIPNSVTSIGKYAFYGCTGLTSVTIPNSVTSIGEQAFSGCTGLTSVVWNVKNCADFTSTSTPFYNINVFDLRSQIKNFIFGDSVEHIPSYLCVGMTNLNDLTIGSSITAISTGDFSGCNNIKNVTINSNAVASKSYSISNHLNSIFGSQVTQYVFGDGVTAIGDYVLYNANSLQIVTIPSSILSIGQSAFDGCSQLETVNLNSNAIVSKAYTATNNFAKIFGSQVLTYNLGDAIMAIGDYAFYNCSIASLFNIPNSVTTIGNHSFAGCSDVISFIIPESVTSIGNNAFRECTGLETQTLPNVTTIGNGAFADCGNLTSLQLGNNLTTIGDSTFSSCYNLQAIAFPSTMKTIGNYAFYQCNRFTAIDIPAGITFLGDGAFKGCTKLTTVSINSNAVMSKTYSSTSNLSTIFGSHVQSFTLSDAVTAIGDYAFYNCTSLPTITIPSNVTKIGGSAFYGCTGLKSMIIPENITSIESNTFHGCTALSSVNLPNIITSIKDSAFFNCSSLQLESLPSSVTTLGKGTFSGCGSLASIAIPASLTSVGENAFNDCSGIAEVKIENVDSWCKIDFGNSKSNPVFYSRNLYIGDSLIAELTIPNKITELKPWAFVNCNSINSVFVPNTVRLFSPNAFYDCENIASVEWHAKNIADYASSAASPFYASRSKITSFVFGEETEHVPSHLCNGMSKINLLSFPSYLKSIGDYSFKDLTKIRKINIPNEVTSIGAHAFDSCILVTSIYLGYQVEEIGDYAFKGCIRVNDITSMNTTTPVVYENTLSSISDYAYLYVPAGSKRTYQLDPYWGRFDIREIASEDATLSKDAVIVEANEDNAIFTWPTENNAASYSLQITKDGVVFCTLVFNSNGQLTGIAFAPGRNGTSHAPAATTSVAGMSFTVTGLDGASKYAYNLSVADDNNQEIVYYQGEFATTGYEGEVVPGGEPVIPGGGTTAIDNVNPSTQSVGTTKFFRNGHLYILRDGKTYTVQGQEVR